MAFKDSSSSSSTESKVKGLLTHGGRYVQYNVYGNFFEVSNKYVPPIRPIGRGAYGIVWYVYSLLKAYNYCFRLIRWFGCVKVFWVSLAFLEKYKYLRTIDLFIYILDLVYRINLYKFLVFYGFSGALLKIQIKFFF